MNDKIKFMKKHIKENINELINKGKLHEAEILLKEFFGMVKDDAEAFSMKSVLLILKGKLEEAEIVIKEGLNYNKDNFDLNYNLAYIYETQGRYNQALLCYSIALNNCKDDNLKLGIEENISRLKNEHGAKIITTKAKIAFFVKQAMDSFLGDIINGLSDEYDVRKIVVTEYPQIEEGMIWADICWFEWCDELIAYGSKLELAREKKIICRLHRYEALTEYPKNVMWQNVDKLIVVTSHLKNFLVSQIPDIEKNVNIITINNGVNLEKFKFIPRSGGFNIAYVGYIHQRKNPILLLQIINSLVKKDKRYKLYVAGEFQDSLIEMYWNYQVKQMGLNNNVVFQGWQTNIDEWLEDKNYIISTSIHESFGYGIAEAMARGIKPIIHNFLFASEIWPKDYLFNTIDEAVDMITGKMYNSKEYRKFIEENYSLEKQIKSIKTSLNETLDETKKVNTSQFNYAEYWNSRLNQMFDIEGVGYIGLGKIYNKYLYENRIYILDNIIKNIFGEISDIKVLELGPGIGIFTEYYKKQGVKKYTAIDISQKSTEELCKVYKDYKFINGDISDKRYYNDKYDLVFAADVLLHITNEDNYKKTISNISKCLNNNGVCILLDPITLINSKSSSEHVVIRDKDYINNIFDDNGLEILQIMPVNFFMNYPFDKKLLENKADLALQLFNMILGVFSKDELTEEHKDIFAQYLLNCDRKLLLKNNFGLSEKLMVIKKKKDTCNFGMLGINQLWHEEKLMKKEEILLKELGKEGIANRDYFYMLDRLIKDIGKEDISLEYVINIFNGMMPYKKDDYDKYDFNTAQIMFGRREKVNNDFEIIEFCIKNSYNKLLLISNIWYSIKDKKSIIPNEIADSCNFKYINKFIEEIKKYNIEYKNNIAGFVFDDYIRKDIETNYLAYTWERGIPCSQFMPVLGYLKICERYKFASSFIKSSYKVLEAPCGFGYGAVYFSKLCSAVEALDLANENIEFARNAYNIANVNWVNGDVTKLPYNDGEFDVYVSYEVFEHLPLELIEKYLKEAKRVIKIGGKFIISTPNVDTRKHINNPFHIKEYTFNEFKTLLNKHFSKIEYYSVSNFRVNKGMRSDAFNMIAVCEKE